KYRMQRWMLTPGIRLGLRIGVPFCLVAVLGSAYMANEVRREALRGFVAELRQSIRDRPEFMIRMIAIDGAGGDLADDIREVASLRFPVSSFDLDVDQIRDVIVALDPVKSATVRIRSGGVLQVDVVEREPVLVWRSHLGLALLDATGAHVAEWKNANISLRREGDDDFALELANPKNNASVFTPGLSGISTREELKTRGALASSVMQGDANTYLRSLLFHLFEDEADLSEEVRELWEDADWNDDPVLALPECKWKRFCLLLSEVYDGARIKVDHDVDTEQYVNINVNYLGQTMPIDLASTGMLQVIQILAYSCFFEPPLLLLDEPDAHLHADSQTKLLSALQGLSDRLGTRILLTSHSPQLIQKMNRQDGIQVIWMEGGAKVELDDQNLPAIPLMMSLGAMGIGSEAFSPEKTVILLTEDKKTDLVKTFARANGANDAFAYLSYNGCNNLQGARQLAVLLRDLRPEIKIIIHRDRDYRTENELRFEKSLFSSWLSAEGASQIVEVFTNLNDIEHKFASVEHLSLVFQDNNADELQQCIDSAISEKRDDFVSRLDRGRTVISDRLYTERMKGKTDKWREAEMPNVCPAARQFRPANGQDPFCFDSCHGKELEKRLRDKLHVLVGGNTADLKARLHVPSDALNDENWGEAIRTALVAD
ncbi:MAG: FtsQ-type POTRA domain-containing protein, partial [Colwellia sp.]|nr:FtsQ-type POTRA domain-containing protein [Colwellia sp.]